MILGKKDWVWLNVKGWRVGFHSIGLKDKREKPRLIILGKNGVGIQFLGKTLEGMAKL